MKLLTHLNSCKATGLDGLPAKFIIDSAESKTVSIYKKNAKTESGNYRPVSVLEMVICEQLRCPTTKKYVVSVLCTSRYCRNLKFGMHMK